MSSAAGPAALPPGSAARALHVELPSQQRRLRHLRNIAARNIINKNGYRLLDTYFTLHLCGNTKIYKEFYKSEVIKNSLVSSFNVEKLCFKNYIYCSILISPLNDNCLMCLSTVQFC